MEQTLVILLSILVAFNSPIEGHGLNYKEP
jgi:hypothetical protein